MKIKDILSDEELSKLTRLVMLVTFRNSKQNNLALDQFLEEIKS